MNKPNPENQVLPSQKIEFSRYLERKGKEFVNNEFIGKIAINESNILTQVPLDSPLAPEWYKLEDKDMDKANLSVGELMLVIWFGTQADEVFIDAWHSYVATVTGLVYLSPRLWYLRVNIIEAQDLVVLETRIRIRRWNEDLMFVAAEPFYDHLVLTVPRKVHDSSIRGLHKMTAGTSWCKMVQSRGRWRCGAGAKVC
ncbi:FT-interacting protein 1-like [Gossypium australe]|uniref:FT-interacting protein 1-like n=1 Tax=Gossypium australe TaxID=47621 RepID=A0A5B6VJY8_9ROSI|nr:FT-interacting protein 1-like [Gossypium australe]